MPNVHHGPQRSANDAKLLIASGTTLVVMMLYAIGASSEEETLDYERCIDVAVSRRKRRQP